MIKNLKFWLWGVVVSLIILPFVSIAVSGVSGGTGITDAAGVLAAINNIADWMYTIFLSVAVIMIVYTAFVYLTAGGGENVGKAHKMMIYSAVAVAVAVLSKGFVTVVKELVK